MNVDLTEATVAVYIEHLLNLSDHELDRACTRTILEWDRPHMMPPLAFILARTGAGAADDQFLAEQAWHQVQQTIRKHWYGGLLPIMASVKPPETYRGKVEVVNGGFLIHPEPFDAATDYAITITGGLERMVEAAGTNELDFIRKDFLQSHRRHAETGGLVAPTKAEAKEFLNTLSAKEIESK